MLLPFKPVFKMIFFRFIRYAGIFFSSVRYMWAILLSAHLGLFAAAVHVPAYILFFFYSGTLIMILSFFIRRLRQTPGLFADMERKLNLNFGLYNHMAFKELVPLPLLGYAQRVQYAAATFSVQDRFHILLTLFIFILHFVFPLQSKSYFQQIKNTYALKPADPQFIHPAVLHENSDLTVCYYGKWDTCGMTITSDGTNFQKIVRSLSNTESIHIPDVKDNLYLKAELTHGIFKKKYSAAIQLYRRPFISGIKTTVTAPFDTVPVITLGSSEIYGYLNSRFTVEVVLNSRRKPKEFRASPFLAHTGSDNGTSIFSGILRKTTTAFISISDTEGFWTRDPLVLNFFILTNKTPDITILEPEDMIQISEKIQIPVIADARDDTSLSRIVLHSEIFSKHPFTSYGRFAETNTVYAPGKPIRQKRITEFLPVENSAFLPGRELRFYFIAIDYYGARSSSRTNTVSYIRLDQIQKKNIDSIEVLSEEYAKKVKESADIIKDFEDLKLKQEKGTLDEFSVSAYKDKLAAFQQEIQNTALKTAETAEKFQSRDSAMSKEIINKLLDIKHALEQIDENILKNLMQAAEDMYGNIQIPEKMAEQYMQNFNPENLSTQLDEILRTIQTVKKTAELTALFRRAEKLYDTHDSILSWTIPSSNYGMYHTNQQGLGDELADIAQSYDAWDAQNMFDDPESLSLMSNIASDLSPGSVQVFRDAKAGPEKGFSLPLKENRKLHRIKENLNLLNRRSSQADIEKALQEIDSQIHGFCINLRFAEDLASGEIYDLKKISENALFPEYSQFLTELGFYTLTMRRRLYDIIAGHIPGILPFFEIYTDAEIKFRTLAEGFDPALVQKKDNLRQDFKQDMNSHNFLIAATLTHVLNNLIALKKFLRNSVSSRGSDDGTEDAMSRQNSMSKRLNSMLKPGSGRQLSRDEQEYLRQSALEQQLIRSLLEALNSQEQAGNNPGGKEGSAPGGKEGNEPGHSPHTQAINKIVEEMKKIEKELAELTPESAEKIKSSHTLIEENFLKFNKGISKPGDEEKEERKAEHAVAIHPGYSHEIDQEILQTDKYFKTISASGILSGYDTRILEFLKKAKTVEKRRKKPIRPVQ